MPSRRARSRTAAQASSSLTPTIASGSADAGDVVAAGLAARQHRTARRLDGDDLHLRRDLAEEAQAAGGGAARADRADDEVDLAVAVLPDLARGRRRVAGGVRGVREGVE